MLSSNLSNDLPIIAKSVFVGLETAVKMMVEKIAMA